MTVVRFPVERTGRGESDRLASFDSGGPTVDTAPKMGTSEDWAWSAIVYLKGKLSGHAEGPVEVSAAAVSIVLMFVEELAAIQGLIQPPEKII